MAAMLESPVPRGARSVSWPWYHHDLDGRLNLTAQEVLQIYSKIPEEEVESHVYRIRDKAWGIFPWPCIGEFWFLSFGLSQHPLYYSQILPRLKAGAIMLDLGSCLAQDIRKCIYDGAPAENLYASDLLAEYEDLSYNLWQDRHIFPQGHYLADDILAENDTFNQGSLMRNLRPGMTDIITINMFLHLFDWHSQLKVATRILRLLSHRPGSLIVGSQAGVVHARSQALLPPFDTMGNDRTGSIFRHSPASFAQLWEQAGIATGIPLQVRAVLQSPETQSHIFAEDLGNATLSARTDHYSPISSIHRLPNLDKDLPLLPTNSGGCEEVVPATRHISTTSGPLGQSRPSPLTQSSSSSTPTRSTALMSPFTTTAMKARSDSNLNLKIGDGPSESEQRGSDSRWQGNLPPGNSQIHIKNTTPTSSTVISTSLPPKQTEIDQHGLSPPRPGMVHGRTRSTESRCNRTSDGTGTLKSSIFDRSLLRLMSPLGRKNRNEQINPLNGMAGTTGMTEPDNRRLYFAIIRL